MDYCINYIGIILHSDTDIDTIDEIENHLSMNGYCFGIDKKRKIIFVYDDQFDYVETILGDRNISYRVAD